MCSTPIRTKPLHRLTLAALALAGGAAFAQPAPAPSFEYRHPMVVKVAAPSSPEPEAGEEDGGTPTPEVAPTTLTLSEDTLPDATVGQYYDFDFNTLLTVGGDDPPTSGDITWALQGLEDFEGEAGPRLNEAGVLGWTPATKGTASFEVVATHEDAEGRQAFTIVVNGVTLRATQISAGRTHTCAVTAQGAAMCWGSNYFGNLGNGTTTDSPTPVAVTGLDSRVTSISVGDNYTCAVHDGGAKCWGFNNQGQLGDGTETQRASPVPVSELGSGVASISVGTHHSCAVTTSGAALCWGFNRGRLGDGTTTKRLTPVPVSGLGSGVAAISAGTDHTCAMTTDGAALCWGYNGQGQLGDSSTTTRTTPVAVSGLESGTASVDAGKEYTCAVTTDGAALCWGNNTYGQLGDGTSSRRTTPVPVSGLDSGVASIAAGSNDGGFAQTCAVTTAGAAMCWGNNRFGHLGDGTTTNSPTPAAVSGLSSGIATISAGDSHTCAVTTGGAAMCWGDNTSGRLGDGTMTSRATPVEVQP